ncbi:MAG: DNA polymerase III subunit delta [Steroidobacteraceae bacterium]|jgi:DNA polymerase-3 subunit delta
MKLSLDELPAQLAQRLLPAYLISGDEPLRVGEASDLIRARARAAGYEEREVFFIERAGAVWDEVQQSAQSLSLFANRRVIEIRMPTGKPGVNGAAALLRVMAAAGDELLLLVITGKLERETQGAEWVRALQARGAWLPIWPIARAQLPQWLQARFRAAGLRADEEALELLAERSEGNLLAAQQEIEKLALLLPPGAAVSATEVAASSADSARFDVFQLGEAVRAMEPGRSLRILAGLQAEGAEALLVLWGLLRIMHGLQASGFSPAGRTGPRPSFARLAARAARVDRVAKGLERGDAWDELALLAVELCGLRPLPWLRAG